ENDAVRRESSRFYDLVALGLASSAHAGFRVRSAGAPMALDPRGLIVSSHRSGTDVPLFIATAHRGAHRRWRRHRAIHFAVPGGLFVPGLFAGFSPDLPTWARRALFPVGIGGIMHERLPCHPIRSATRMRVVELLREHPEAPLAELLPERLLRRFRDR